MPATSDHFPVWLDRQLAERGWDVPVLAKRTGISSSIIYRWRKGYRPNVDNCRRVARAMGMPILRVLVAAGVLSREEAHTAVSVDSSLDEFATVDLSRELHRRIEHDHIQAPPHQPVTVQDLAAALQGMNPPQPGQRPATEQYLQSVPTGEHATPQVITDSAGNRYALQRLHSQDSAESDAHPE